MIKTFAFIVLAASLIGGCAGQVRSYGFNYPSFDKQAWTQTYPANRDRQSVKCILENDRTGAVIRYVEDTFHGTTAKDTAMAYRILFGQRDYKVADDIDKYEGGQSTFAGFTFVKPDGSKGKVIAVRQRGVDRVIVLIGEWPPQNDAAAAADLDRLALELDVSQYSH